MLCNSCVPISYIIHSRQLSYLHHVLHLDHNDPVRKMYVAQMQQLPYEKNWVNEVTPLLQKYGLGDVDLLHISKEAWKRKVKHSVTQRAFEELTTNISNKSKTKHLSYASLTPQSYVFSYHHKQSSIVFKLRSRSINCKANRKSNNGDLTCRLCHNAEETQAHVINCPKVSDGLVLDISTIDGPNILPNDATVIDICKRVDTFNHLVNNLETVNEET